MVYRQTVRFKKNSHVHPPTITTPWEVVSVDLIGPYILKGKDGTQIDLICVTMIDPATIWFEIVELLASKLSVHNIPMGTQGCKGLLTHKQKEEAYFEKNISHSRVIN